MDTRLTRIAGLMLGLSLLGSGAAAASAHSVLGAVPVQTNVAAPGTGAGLDAAPYQFATLQTLAQAEDPACALEGPDAANEVEDPNDTDNIHDENGADDAAEGDTGVDSPADEAAEDAAGNPNDTDSLQCGDQNGADNAGQ
jgi:hypothetical protein